MVKILSKNEVEQHLNDKSSDAGYPPAIKDIIQVIKGDILEDREETILTQEDNGDFDKVIIKIDDYLKYTEEHSDKDEYKDIENVLSGWETRYGENKVTAGEFVSKEDSEDGKIHRNWLKEVRYNGRPAIKFYERRFLEEIPELLKQLEESKKKQKDDDSDE